MRMRGIGWTTICFLMIMLTYTVSSEASGPNENEIRNYVESRLPRYMSISSIKYKNFPENSGKGRTSIVGEFALEQNAYKKDTNHLFSQLKSIGWDRRWFDHVNRSLTGPGKRKTTYKLASRKGLNIRYNIDLYYKEIASGFVFDGEIPLYWNLGWTKSDLRKDNVDFMIIDSDEYNAYVDRLFEKGSQWQEKYKEIQKEIKYWFTTENIHAHKKERNGSFSFNFEINLVDREVSQWFLRTDGFSKPVHSIEGQIIWKKNGGWANNRYKAGDVGAVQVIVYTDIVRAEPLEWTARIHILVPDKRRQNQFYRTSHNLVFYTDPERYEGRESFHDTWVVVRESGGLR